MANFTEKRRAQRRELVCPIGVREPDTGQVLQGNTKNLSGRGILFVLDKPYPVGTVLDVSVAECELNPAFEGVVEVVRVKEAQPGRYDIGGIIRARNERGASLG